MIDSWAKDKKQIQEAVELAVMHMRNELAITNIRIQEVTVQFVNQTPPLLALLHNKNELKRWDELSSILHKIKSRYAYFGFDEIEKELGAWEELLKEGKLIDNLELKLNQLDLLTNDIIAVFKHSEFYETTHMEKPSSSTSLRQKSVLIAEDDDVSMIVLESIIMDWGAKLIRASDGFEAIAKTVKEGPDLIFMDVHMPFLSGLDAIRAIRGKGIKTTIVAMSASSQLGEREETVQAGSNDFLTKPVNGNSMQQMMDKYLGPSLQ